MLRGVDGGLKRNELGLRTQRRIEARRQKPRRWRRVSATDPRRWARGRAVGGEGTAERERERERGGEAL